MMSKKATIISILIIGILLWNYGFFNKYNYLTAKSDIANKNFQIVYIGESMLTVTHLNKISEKYGFKTVQLSCVISSTEQNGIELYNSQMNNHLNKVNGVGWKNEYKKEIDSLIKLTNIPKTAFWVEKNGKGFWYNVDFLHNHKNNAKISIFDKYGKRIVREHFILICPSDEIEFIDKLETQIDFYDGENIHFKSNCYLMKRRK